MAEGMQIHVDAQSRTAILLEGKFNPSIFRVQWLASIGALEDGEAKGSKDELNPFVSDFSGPGFEGQVTLDRYLIRVSESSDEDLILRITSRVFEVLLHTPVESVGVQRAFLIPKDSPEWQAIAGWLPRARWERLMPETDIRERLTIAVQRVQFEDGRSLQVDIAGDLADDINVEISESYSLSGDELTTREAMELLQNHWVRSSELAKRLMQGLLSPEEPTS
jgi:hypothetical protein